MSWLINNEKYFLDAVFLLEKQIEFNYKSPLYIIHFDFFQRKYDRDSFKNENIIKKYFNTKIKNNIFYSISDDFYLYNYPVPKGIFWVRNYTFFSYELYLVYYSLWVYFFHLSSKLIEYKNLLTKSLNENNSFYLTYSGTKIWYIWDKINTNKPVFKYHEHYNDFYKNIKKYSNCKIKNKIIIKLDLQNFFDDIDLEIFLNFLDWNINNREDLEFNDNMKKEILDFFNFIWFKKWIPQSDENIISSYISDLFLLKSDFKIIDFLKSEKINFSFFRYVDDMFFIFDEDNLWIYKEQPFLLLQKFSDIIYNEVNIRLNKDKNSIFYLNDEEKWRSFLKEMKNISQISHVIENDDEWKIEHKVKDIFDTIKNIKKLPNKNRWTWFLWTLEWSYKLNYTNWDLNKLNNIFSKDKEWVNLLNIILKNNSKDFVKKFKWFNFNYINYIYKPLLALIETSKDYKKTFNIYKKFIKFIYKKNLNSLFDIFLLSKYIIKYKFLFEKNEQKILNSKYSFLSLFYNKPVKITTNISWYYKNINLNINITEQIKYRIIYENSKDYSRAFSHLLNEFHSIIFDLDKSKKIKDYKQDDVKKYLLWLWNISSNEIIEIWNFFDRRNKNNISHSNWFSITEDEYFKYKELVLNIYKKI